ncbi:hypothetical protein EIN_247160 [Entamoeba invadens IP1]|uniref:RING-type domain-containing protein n=1 Tax=Entamoeba invadens IP1 TaxID=370355 RepID=A0A0A1UH73_ENTIV|nr:hypothetical protein EIN_247160 [Entamoeba invadens IP1]ELP94822.1 hypothetical protein EIN_247160 [Entamoeba invadens IP1]|eukprot:XP_004261593.1 hypothetical protein EIN_247160 [Entamoeba invadens IP1]
MSTNTNEVEIVPDDKVVIDLTGENDTSAINIDGTEGNVTAHPVGDIPQHEVLTNNAITISSQATQQFPLRTHPQRRQFLPTVNRLYMRPSYVRRTDSDDDDDDVAYGGTTQENREDWQKEIEKMRGVDEGQNGKERNKEERANKVVEGIVCPICYQTTKDVQTTKCGHLFCSECLEVLLNTQGVHYCPICRSKISKSSSHKIFL